MWQKVGIGFNGCHKCILAESAARERNSYKLRGLSGEGIANTYLIHPTLYWCGEWSAPGQWEGRTLSRWPIRGRVTCLSVKLYCAVSQFSRFPRRLTWTDLCRIWADEKQTESVGLTCLSWRRRRMSWCCWRSPGRSWLSVLSSPGISNLHRWWSGDPGKIGNKVNINF